MTDNPVIISGDKLLIIDPFRTKNKLGNDCHTLKFKKLQKTVQKKRHYKQAVVAMETLYGHCGFTKESLKNEYHGTLFWFPLRRSASKLSTKVFNHRDVKELITMFKKEAPCLPLFLKNITQVSFHNKDELISSFSVTCSVEEKKERTSFNLKFAACKGRSPDNDMKAIFPVNVTVKDGKEVKTQRWVVCNYVKGLNSLSGDLRTLTEDTQLSYSPFVGIAAPIDNRSDATFHGHVFCFLPLPSTGENYTGLPVHINGFFALSQDRHHVKWPTDNQPEREDEAQRWNRFLCEEVIVAAYTDTLDYMKKRTVRQNCMEADNLVYKILPSRQNVRPNWNTIVDPLYRSLKTKDVFYTKNNGRKWVQSKDAIFSILKWNEDKSINVRETEQCIVDLLLDCQRNVVNVPSHVADMFPDVARITPKFLRNVMRERPIYTRYPSEHKLVLLQFILADRRYSDLSDLQLLPLEDETFRSFDNGYPNYICTKDEMKIFPGIEQNFVKLDIAQTILSHLNEMQTEGIFDLRNLNHEEFPSLLKETLSANGKLGENGCFGIITSHITMKWLDKGFGYIRQHEIPLEKVENMFLVPVIDDSRSKNNLKLMPLKGRYVVANCDRMNRLDQTLSNALSNLTFTVLEHIPKGETHIELMGTYCKYPDLEGIFELLEGLHDDCKGSRQSLDTTALHFNKRSNHKEKAALLNFLSKDCKVTSQKVDNIIRQLDIFPETSNVDNDVKYTSISKNERIACRNCIPVKYHAPLLHLKIPQKNLAERLGATEVSEGKIVEEILRAMVNSSTGYKRPSIERFMKYVLENLITFGVNQTRILDLGSRIEFIEISTAMEINEVAPIGRFFDHTDRNLQELFHFDKSKLLPTNYQEKALEPALRKFGLKSEKDVKPEDVHHLVQILDRECRKKEHVDKKKINKCSLQVMKLLEKMASKSRNNLDSFHLEGYRWITFIRNRPSHYPDILPWYGDQFESLLCSPEDILSNKHESLSASVKCIVETPNHPYLAERYGWTKPPSVEICLLQLEAVKKVFCIKHKATLMFMIKCIYQQLSNHIESSVERLKLPLERLKAQAVVCTGEEFRLPEEVFISFPKNGNIDLKAFMHKLPVEFSEFSAMFVFLGSTAELTVSSFKSILTTIKTTTRTPTTKRDRKIAIRILKCIASLKDTDTSLNGVLVPVKSDKASLDLYPVEECTYCTIKESSLFADIDVDSNVRYVHSDVSAELAESLGIQSFTRKYMSDGGMEEMYSACGQSEPLTTRLKHVLENYPDGLAVLKELVQNADDAGAQHICFLYDERQNKNARTGLIDENMAKCQGPALWAYNNAEFTEVDFQNIVKLGGETKKGTKTKIGKFGLGFCAVYNLTDVPSFLSGSSLVILDPHTTYLGKAIKDKSSPGIRLNFTEKSSGILKLRRNQFRPYNKIFGCDLSGDIFPLKFEGTLFRLPLRTKEQALKSAIKCTPYCRDDMVTLLHLLKDCAGSLLTFTQNIKEIKLFHLPEDSEDPANDIQLIFSTDKTVSKTHPIFTNPADVNVMKEVEKACGTKQAFTYIERISVKMHMPKNRFLSVERSYVKSSPWLVAWASGTGRVLLEHSVRLESEGALPLGSIAVSLKKKSLGFTAVPFPYREKLPGFYNTSHLFCFLPLPVECKTPVHINGCFAVSSDRKDLVKRTSDEKGETTSQTWNRMLMSDAVCNAYVSMLTSLDQFGVSSEHYSLLWPIIKENEKYEGKAYLAEAFCKKVISGDHRVFYRTRGRWASFRDCVFLDNGFRHNKKVGSIAFETLQRFYQGANIPMDMSEPLYQQFCTAGCKEELGQQTMTMKTFYEEIVFPNINQIDGKKRDALVIFILKDDQHHLHQLLKSNPCIPVRPDDRLRLPRELVRPKSKVSALFCNGDGRYPSDVNQLFCSESILDILVELGMMDKTLSGELILERATSIAELSDPKEALRRCRKLLAYLDREQHNCGQIINVLSSIAFIPSLQKPSHWPLSWVSTSSDEGKVKFCPPNQMFFPSQMYQIACSQLIADTEGLNSELKVKTLLQLLGVRVNVSHNDVEAQLLAISKVRCDDLSNMQRSTLHSICHSVYEYLDSSQNKLLRKYDDLPIIWMSNRLIPPSHATLDTFDGIDCTPAIYQLGKSEVTKYTHFLKCVGVQETLTKENVISALAKVQKDNNKSQRLKNVKLTVNLLQFLVLVCERIGSKLGSDEKSRIFVPDDANVFRLADELCVDDGYTFKREHVMHFVNKKISEDISKLLDIKSKRVKHLNSIKGSMPFGQKEELVKRLKGILEGYPRDEAILYELLQNADDAGAKEIMFIQDMRQHEAKKGIFGKTWSAIQGPALCVFNDSCFTTEDLQGICKLGEGSKSQDPTKTGQFGIGFNVVYHLTDAPSFITRGLTTPKKGTFCMFDLHCKFCPVAEDNPGLQLPDLKDLEETYPGVYECYLQKEFPREQGTWFRFPLRNEQMARESLICNKPMHSELLKELLQQFRENMKKCLLFLRNIRKISLWEIDNQGNIIKNYTVESSLERNDERNLGKFCHKCDTLTKALHDRSVDLQNIEMQTVKYIMTIQEHSPQPERWIIAQTFGLDSKAKLPDSVSTAFQYGDIALTPKGAVALPYTSQDRDRDAGARTEAEYDEKRLNTPFPKYHDRQGVVQLSPAGSSSEKSKAEGQAFCFLPLPLKTGLPIHMNGHFALVQTRGSLWEKSHRGDWNRLLFKTAISNSYVLAVEYLRDTVFGNGRERFTMDDNKSSLEKYHQVFPRYGKGKNDLIKCMITSFFSILYEKESTVFPVLSQNASQIWWVALQKKHEFYAYFDNLRDQFQPASEPNTYRFRIQSKKEAEENIIRAAKEAHQLSDTLKGIGMKLLESPLWIFESMVQALQKADNVCGDQFMSEKHLVHPYIVIQFLRTDTTSPDACLLKHINCRVMKTPVKSIENIVCLLRYCLKDLNNFVKHIEQLPLLVTNDAILRRFSPKQPVFLSLFCDLLLKSAREFVHGNLVTLLPATQLQNGQCLKSLDLNSFFTNATPQFRHGHTVRTDTNTVG
ncbi:sacsin-like [Mizuhopecten yessoensis]|uniref:Sacsin n=1 Tax=Mizuhopecten yessoensis TaxID=6573 RepID=A0A210QIF4_MIZYE|nr:sacsin-like [Mizuhopecten yessoensis]OWF48527.1 Sacsin [Mizuhopecten yessoensis]